MQLYHLIKKFVVLFANSLNPLKILFANGGIIYYCQCHIFLNKKLPQTIEKNLFLQQNLNFLQHCCYA